MLLVEQMANVGSEVFTSTNTHCHGIVQGRLTASEQVMGRSRAIQVNVLLSTEELGRLRELLQREFSGTGVRYWAMPLAFDGEFT